MRIVKWGSVTICKTNVLKDTILNFLKIVTEITLGIPSISSLNQNMTIFPLFVKITEFRPTTPTTSDCVWSLHSGFMIAFSLICN